MYIRYVRVHLLVVCLLLCGMGGVRFAHAATPDSIEQCLQQGLAQVLAGKVPARQYMYLPGIVSRVFGPPAGQLDETNRKEAVNFMAARVQELIDAKRHKFPKPVIKVTGLKTRSGYPNIYGVYSTITVKGTPYELRVNGYFYSGQKCAVYGVVIERSWSLIQHLKDVAGMREKCAELTGMQC